MKQTEAFQNSKNISSCKSASDHQRKYLTGVVLPLSHRGHLTGSSKFLRFTLLILSLMCFTLATPAQSGRKIPKPTKPPEETKQPGPEERKPEPKNEVPKIPMLVGYYSQNMNISPMFSQLVAESCAARLGESDIAIQMAKEMNRKEASDIAKKSDQTYTVLLQLNIDSFNQSSANMGYADPRNLFIEYTAFEPKTGKVRANGRVYQRRAVNDPLSLPQSTAAAQERLRRAGEEAADRILASLNLPIPPPHR